MSDITVTLCSHESGDDGWPPSNLTEFVAWLEARRAQIPAEYQSTATLNIGHASFYDSTYATITIEYKRPETDDERRQREAIAARHRYLIERNERTLLADLQRKYGDKK